MDSSERILYTVGHSIYPMEEFFRILDMHKIEVVADVRSNPYSKYAKHFTGSFLKVALAEHGLKYVFLGQEIGGKPKEEEFYDADGFADYAKLATSEKFAVGMDRLEKGIEKFTVGIMCGEEDPSGCHRHLLISKVAHGKGILVKHIRKGGEVQDYDSFMRESSPEEFATQLNLFGQIQNDATNDWKSQVRIKTDEP